MERVLRTRRLYGKNYFFLFNWILFINTQSNCMFIGTCRTKQMNQWLGGGETAYGYAVRQNGRGVWLNKRPLRHRISDFFERSDLGVQLIARPGMQYKWNISGNRGYASNRVRSLSIFHLYSIEDEVQSHRAMMKIWFQKQYHSY